MTATLASPVGGGPRFGEGRLHISCRAPHRASRLGASAPAPLALEPPSLPAAASISRPSRCCAPSTDARLAAPGQTAVPVRATVSPCPSASPRRAPGAEIAPAPLPEGTTVTSAPASTPASRQHGHRSPLHEPCPKSNRATPTAASVVGSDDGGAPASAPASAVPNFTSARRTAHPVCRPRVSAVADGDERCDIPPDTGDDGAHERAAPTSVASLCTSTPLAVRQSVAGSLRSSAAALREPTLGPAAHGRRRVPYRCAHPLRAIPLPRMTITVAVPMAKVRLRVRPPPPC